MRTERWFNVLVLGGAVLGQACGTDPQVPPNQPGAGGGGAGAGGAGSPGAGDAGSGKGGSGGASSSGAGEAGGGSAARGEGASGSGGASSGGASSGGASSGGASSGASGVGGSGGELQCHVDSKGYGDPRDPCGCPCCWARDCLNTEVPCCGVFCRSGDNGASCCPQ
jgi:hypothetical protein